MVDPTEKNRQAVGSFLKKLVPSGSPLGGSIKDGNPSVLTPEAQLKKKQAEQESQVREVTTNDLAEREPAKEVEFEESGLIDAPVANQVSGQKPSNILSMYDNAANKEAAAQEDLGNKETAVLTQQSEMLNQQAIEEKKQAEKKEQDLTTIKAETTRAQADLDSFKIEPHGYFHNKSTFQKIIGGIGMFLGSLTQEGAKNVAATVNREIERDTENQKTDYNLRKGKVDGLTNRYKAYMDKYKDDQMARFAMNKEKLLAADYQLKSLQASSKGPLARAKMEMGKVEIAAKVAEIEQKQIERMAKVQEKNDGGSIPGYSGSNKNPSIVKDVYDRSAAADSASSTIAELEKLSKEGGATMPLSEKNKKAKLLTSKLAAELAKASFGRSSDSELQITTGWVPDITSWTQTKGIDASVLKTLKERVNKEVDAYAKKGGYTKNSFNFKKDK